MELRKPYLFQKALFMFFPYSPILWPWVWVSSSTSDLLVM